MVHITCSIGLCSHSFLSLGLLLFHFRLGKYFSSQEEAPVLPELKKGAMYLIKGNVERSYELFARVINENTKGLLITRNYLLFANAAGQKAKETLSYSLRGVTACWLSQKEEEDALVPTQLHKLVYIISEMLFKNNGSVVLLDGIEYLVVHNKFEHVLKQLYIIREILSRHDGILLIPLDPEAFSEKELGLLEKESISL